MSEIITRIIVKIKKNKLILLFLFLNLLFYGAFAIKHYAPDTYYTEALGWHPTVLQYFKNGRWLMVVLSYICEVLNISSTCEQAISWMTGILSVTIAEYLIYRLLKNKFPSKEGKGDFWKAVIAFMMISNVFMLEYFIFAEYTGMMCLGLLFDVLAAVSVLRYLEGKRTADYLFGLGFAVLGINGHQGNFAVLVLLCVIFSADLYANIKKFIWGNAVIGSVYLLPAVLNAWQVHIGGAERLTGSVDIIASFRKSTEGLISLFKSTANFMPYKFYAVFAGLMGVLLLYFLVRRKSWGLLGKNCYWALIALLGIYSPLIITDVNYIDVVPRTVFIMGSIVPVILISLLYMDVTPKRCVFLPALVLLFLCVQYYGILKITTSHFQANAVDRYEAQYIGDYLRAYEAENGVKVTKMAVYWDKYVCGWAPGVIGYGAVNERVLSNEWAAPLAIKCLDGYQLEMTAKSEEVYETYFKDKDWRQIHDEQIVIIDDVLHYCAY